jgi:Tubulin-tyrosine ligase family
MADTSLTEFVANHRQQLDQLQIPEPLFRGLKDKLKAALHVCGNSVETSYESGSDEPPYSHQSSAANLFLRDKDEATADYGTMLVLPHVVSWNMHRGQGLIESLQALGRVNRKALQEMWGCLQRLEPYTTTSKPLVDEDATPDDDDSLDVSNLVNAIADHPALWSRVILYRSATDNGSVRGAIPAPPYLPQVVLGSEADCTGPFPFVYHHPISKMDIDVSLLYVSPEAVAASLNESSRWPTVDLAPSYQIPDKRMQMIRYAALLHGTSAMPPMAAAAATDIYDTFVRDMHSVHAASSVRRIGANACTVGDGDGSDVDNDESASKVYRVFTDADDPMQLKHPVYGLEANSPHFVVVDSLDDADIVYSFNSVFAPHSPIYAHFQRNKSVMINQFPFEGAFVQKDHLARELLKQHGLPRPSWSLETYDLDVQLGEFVGAVVSETSSESVVAHDGRPDALRGRRSLWIIKPARGTLSKGHVVTRSLAHVVRLLDTGGGRVAQRYIERPICVNGRKVDCRCLVLMVPPPLQTESTEGSSDGLRQPQPLLYTHKTVYFRIAHKVHNVSTAMHLTDHESVLTASHVLDSNNRSSTDELSKLPVASDTIAKLEADYPGSFDWEGDILPKIQTMIRELFNGMTGSFPAMMQSTQSRALYGVDVMFEIDNVAEESIPSTLTTDTASLTTRMVVTPKLTEVTFCPANNAICDAYEQDDAVRRTYNKDIFECLFLGKVSSSIEKLQ